MWMTSCKQPISDDCTELTLTAGWALQCLYPVVERLAGRVSSDEIVDEVISAIPQCHIELETDTEVALAKRIKATVEAILRDEPSWLSLLLDGFPSIQLAPDIAPDDDGALPEAEVAEAEVAEAEPDAELEAEPESEPEPGSGPEPEVEPAEETPADPS